MLSAVFNMARPLLLALDPERAHEATLAALERGLYPRPQGPDAPQLAQSVWGLKFPNPLGIAAGFDKNARVADAILDMGFGFAEVGTVTPEPQAGNPRPRVFRLIEARAVINRLGFNNAGHGAVRRNLERARARRARATQPGITGITGIIGVNIGAGRGSEDRVADYVRGLEAFAALADYFTINISSPNTPGLRDLQAPDALDALLGRAMAKRAALVDDGQPWRPIVVKLAPDIEDDAIGPIVQTLLRHGVDGIAVSNTTTSRAGLLRGGAGAGAGARNTHLANEPGGLSGRPLFRRSTELLARVYLECGGAVPLIGIGGIDSPEAALAKMRAGATLLQLYTGLIYEGPGLLGRIKRRLVEAVEEAGGESVGALIGSAAEAWAAGTIA